MRCKNCGWPNKPSETTCVKCNSQLLSDDDNIDVVGGGDMSQTSLPLNKTVLEDDVIGSDESNNTQREFNQIRVENAEILTQCPKCGYPLRAGVDKCPNCKFQISPTITSEKDRVSHHPHKDLEEDTYHRPTRMESNNGSKSNFRETINPYMMNMGVEPSFILKPIKRMEERHDFDEQEYEGKQVVLNRDNTEQNNTSITSKQQAIITNSEGRWYIEDKSEQKTTFVQASQKIELHDGDIILLGNRLFEFRK